MDVNLTRWNDPVWRRVNAKLCFHSTFEIFFNCNMKFLRNSVSNGNKATWRMKHWLDHSCAEITPQSKRKITQEGFCPYLYLHLHLQGESSQRPCRLLQMLLFRFSGVGLKSVMCLRLGGLPPVLIFLYSFQPLACHDIFLILCCLGFTAVAGVCASRVAGFLNINRNYPYERERGRRGREKRKWEGQGERRTGLCAFHHRWLLFGIPGSWSHAALSPSISQTLEAMN